MRLLSLVVALAISFPAAGAADQQFSLQVLDGRVFVIERKPSLVSRLAAPLQKPWALVRATGSKLYGWEQSKPVQCCVHLCGDIGAVAGGWFYLNNFARKVN